MISKWNLWRQLQQIVDAKLEPLQSGFHRPQQVGFFLSAETYFPSQSISTTSDKQILASEYKENLICNIKKCWGFVLYICGVVDIYSSIYFYDFCDNLSVSNTRLNALSIFIVI